MQKVDLSKVLEALVNEDRDEATGLVHEWIVQLSGQVHESLMAEDEASPADDIADDQDAIKAEEFYGEDDEGGEEAAPEAGEEMPAADVPAGDETVEVKVSDLDQLMANLHAEFAAIMNGEPLPGAEDAAADMDMDMEPGAEAGVEDAPADELDIEEPAVEAINVAEEAEEVEESDDEDVEESVVEADEFDDLDEAFEDLEESTLPTSSPDSDDAEPVEIKAKEHKGFEREAAPGTKKPATPKGEVGNARKDGKTVSKDGDKSAMLNKKTGFGSDSPKSPLSGLKKGK